MIVIQVPSAIYSYASWNKSQVDSATLKKMSIKGILISIATLLVTYTSIYFTLKHLNGSGAIFDAFFLSTSLISCILLAKYYRAAYVFIFLSGVAGTALWMFQFFLKGQGITLMTLNAFVLINAVIGIIKNYRKVL